MIRAPRWSVVGLTGKATPCSRGSSSRPPPEETAPSEIPGDAPPAATVEEKAGERPEGVPPEKREALQKAFRPPPSVPDDL